MRSTRLILLGAVVVATVLTGALALLLVGGGDDDGGASSATPTSSATGASSTLGGATPSGSATAAPTTAPGGEEIALDVPEAGGAVSLAAGNYRTARFQPRAYFSLPDGWSAAFDTARFVDLYRGDDAGDNCVCLINPDGVVEQNGGPKQPLPGGGTVDDMIDWLTSNAGLKTSNPSSLQVGNLPGRQLDVEVQPGSAEVEYLSAADQRFTVKAGERQHLTVLDFRGAALIIAQRSPVAEYSEYFTFVEQVVGGLTFAN